MKLIILILIVTTTLLAGITLPGYRSSIQIEEAGLTKVFVKQELNAEQKAATSEEWIRFKSESEIKISDNEIRIAELSLNLKNPAEVIDKLYRKKVVNLEQQNKYMKARLDAYEKSKSNWQSFKRGFNSEMDVIGNALKDMTIFIKK
jgi:hypothetical protein